MQTFMTRRAFCCSSLTLVPSIPSGLPFRVTTPETPDPVIEAVTSWLRLAPVLMDIECRREAAFDDRDAAEVDRLEWEWDRISRVADEQMTIAVNTQATTPEAITAKITLYRAAMHYFGEESDDYILERISDDIEALSGEA
jgi:hypothetical protein